MSLYDDTMNLLKADERTLEDIAKKSGVVSYSWLAKFHAGLIPNPGVNTIETLYLWLKKTKKRQRKPPNGK